MPSGFRPSGLNFSHPQFFLAEIPNSRTLIQTTIDAVKDSGCFKQARLHSRMHVCQR
jgi:hypothetical protein